MTLGAKTEVDAYERRIPFSVGDEERIASAGLWGIIVALSSIISSLLGVGTSLLTALRMPGDLVSPMVYLSLIPAGLGLAVQVLLGVWLLQASLAFRKVALTDEVDQQHLLRGFSKLRNYFMLIGILIIIVVSLGALALTGALTCGSFMR
ncbi:MAG: hypothetical protein V1772_09990 [Chloroflexota bacterium]